MAWFESFGLNMYLFGCGVEKHRVIEILAMDEISTFFTSKILLHVCFFSKYDFTGSKERSLRDEHVGCSKFGFCDQAW